MAHAGRLWPVKFRRDWNLNVLRNDVGWPAGLLVTTVVDPNSIYPQLNGKRWHLIDTPSPSTDFEFWLSPSQAVGGTLVHLEAQIRFTGSPTGYQLRFLYVLDGIGTKYLWRNLNDGNTTPRWVGIGGQQAREGWDPVFWHNIDPQLQNSSVVALNWANFP